MSNAKKSKKHSKGKRGALWAEAKKRCRLNADEVRMAQEMGLNPRSLIKNIPTSAQQWKAPVGEWVRDMYEKRQAKAARRKQAWAKAERDASQGDPP